MVTSPPTVTTSSGKLNLLLRSLDGSRTDQLKRR
jgi:hypothetical protein